jgi:TetR/AcrR family transcriptional repressor of bet genes
MARPSNTDERREQITRALQQVMARKGYDGASIADVASAAGLTTGLVHYHFKNKLEILLAVLARLVREHDQALAAALAEAEGDARAELALFLDFHLALERADAETLACWITLSGEALREPRVRRAFAAAMAASVEQLAGVLARGAAARQLTCADPAAAAAALMALVQGYYVLAAASPAVVPRGSAAAAARAMAEGLVGARLPARRGGGAGGRR